MTVEELVKALLMYEGSRIVVINSTDDVGLDRVAGSVIVYDKDVIIEGVRT